VAGGEPSFVEAAALLRLPERQEWRLRVSFERDRPATWCKANRERVSARLADTTMARILELDSGATPASTTPVSRQEVA
jgi:hypothetical protein